MLKMSPSIVSPDSKKKLTARKSTGGSQPYKRPPTPNSPSPEPELITLDSEDEGISTSLPKKEEEVKTSPKPTVQGKLS